MTLTRVITRNIGMYEKELEDFMKTGWKCAKSDLYAEKTIQTRLVGFYNAIRSYGYLDVIHVEQSGGNILLTRKDIK